MRATDQIPLKCSFQKVIRTLAFSGRENVFKYSLYYKILGVV